MIRSCIHNKQAARLGYLAAASYIFGIMASSPVRAIAEEPPTPPPDTSVPAPIPAVPGLVTLFGGKQEDVAANWVQNGHPARWQVENGAMIADKTGNISTGEKYTDFQLHVEFRVPFVPGAKGQARGNSGVILQGRYEIQVLDSYGFAEPGRGDCGALYNQAAPLVNACKPPLQWQTYDITFRAPRFDPTTHEMQERAHVTVLQNGLIVQNNQVIMGLTHVSRPKKPAAPANGANSNATAPVEDFGMPGPIVLQFHGNPVAFRNIWILPLPAEGAKHYQGSPK